MTFETWFLKDFHLTIDYQNFCKLKTVQSVRPQKRKKWHPIEGGIALAKALGTNGTLKSLNIGANGLGPSFAKTLSTSLTNNSTLTELNIGIRGYLTKTCSNMKPHHGLHAIRENFNPLEQCQIILDSKEASFCHLELSWTQHLLKSTWDYPVLAWRRSKQ